MKAYNSLDNSVCHSFLHLLLKIIFLTRFHLTDDLIFFMGIHTVSQGVVISHIFPPRFSNSQAQNIHKYGQKQFHS